jgi:hypothetical protein
MNIQALKDRFASFSDITSFLDEPLLFILILGTMLVAFLLILLKFSFNSMKKADQRELDQFIDKNEFPNK